jgi:AcrR family transcriptional regulator
MMPRHEDTGKRIVEAALKLFAEQGYHNTGIGAIAEESGCTKAALYHYFSSKEELGYAAIDEWVRLFRKQAGPSRLRTAEHPIDRLIGMLDDFPSALRLETNGSIVMGLAHGMAAVHEGFRERLRESMTTVVEEIEDVVRKGVVGGQIAESVDPNEVAHVFATMSAGIRHASILWDQEVIWEDARHWMKEYLNSLRK